jgi:hypothetical protein
MRETEHFISQRQDTALSRWAQFIEPVVGRLDLARSFNYVALHIGRQVGKVVGTPASFAVFTEGFLEGAISQAIIIGGHDAFSSMRKGCQDLELTDTTGRREPASEAGGQFVDLAA